MVAILMKELASQLKKDVILCVPADYPYLYMNQFEKTEYIDRA